MRSRKALSPVLTIIVIFALAVGVSLLVVVLIGALTSVETHPYLELKVEPRGYPEIGRMWNLSVFKIDVSERHLVYTYAENASIEVNILTKTKKTETYNLLTNNKGKATFQYLEKYSEVGFQAFLEAYKASSGIIRNQSYISQKTLAWLAIFSIGSFALALGGKNQLGKKRRSLFGKILSWTLVLIMGISVIILVPTIYFLLFKNTLWGFPSEIVAPITFETLKWFAFFTVLSYALAGFLLYLDARACISWKKQQKF